MERLRLHNGSLAYQSTGDGFPLVLLPGPEGMADWLSHTPLLSELCQVIAYEGCGPRSAIHFLPDVLEALRLERIYLASPFPEWLPTLEFACLHPQLLEAVLLVEFPDSKASLSLPDSALSLRLADVTLPTLFLLADDNGPARTAAERLSVQLPSCQTIALGRIAQGQSDLPSTPRRQFPHLMMRFLLDRERHRNLVRGASFLL
ncbi:MAG: hypothetical protein OXC69_06080 [Candidatus Tectomicrobia bacterium]|nr:hypothetical protein [Candidatus Tectomicrobia bacterium]